VIIEKDWMNYSVNDNDRYYMCDINDQYHENNNHFLWIFDDYFLDWNNRLSKKNKRSDIYFHSLIK
jgi:hypothetical protein